VNVSSAIANLLSGRAANRIAGCFPVDADMKNAGSTRTCHRRIAGKILDLAKPS